MKHHLKEGETWEVENSESFWYLSRLPQAVLGHMSMFMFLLVQPFCSTSALKEQKVGGFGLELNTAKITHQPVSLHL